MICLVKDDLKDILYIKGNKLYIDRYVGEITLNKNWEWKYQNIDGFNHFHVENIIDSTLYAKGISTHFIGKSSFEDMKMTKSSFSDFIIKYNFKTCTLLKKDNVYYKISNSIGFDSDTVKSISSTHDF